LADDARDELIRRRQFAGAVESAWCSTEGHRLGELMDDGSGLGRMVRVCEECGRVIYEEGTEA
jgi:hypothetical protein